MTSKLENRKKQYDVIVVGAGPGGCSTAYNLSRYKYDVLLVDKASFPRDKICGDSILPRSLQVLNRMGLLEKIEQNNFRKNTGVIMSSPNYNMIRGDIPKVDEMHDYLYVIPRRIFDNILLDHVKDTGARTLEGFCVDGLIFEEGRVAGIKGPEGLEVRSKVVVGADGVHSKVAQSAGLFRKDSNHEAVCVRAYFDGVEGLEDYIEIHCDPMVLPGYGWIFPMGGTRANVGLGFLLTHVKKKDKNIRQIFYSFLSENPNVRKKLKNARMIGELKGWPERFGSMAKNCYSDGVLLVGDAACFIDPGSGEGIYYALRSGELAAEVIHKAFSKGDFSKETLREYESKWRQDFSQDFKYGRINTKIIAGHPFVPNYQAKKGVKNKHIAGTIAGTLCGVYSKKALTSLKFISKMILS